MDLVEIASARHAWAAEQHPHPLLSVLGVQDRAGAFLHCRDFEGGLTVIDRGIARAEATLSDAEQALATGLLHLRGMTLGGRLGDPVQAQRHIDAAWTAIERFSPGPRIHYQLFTPANIASHVLVTQADLGRPDEVIRLAEELTSTDTGLPPTRMALARITTARAHLELGDRASAQAALAQAWTITPQLAKTDPMALEILRVLYSLHNRSRPQLLKLARQAELPI